MVHKQTSNFGSTAGKKKGKLMKSPKKTSLLTKSLFLPLTDTIHYTFKKDFSLKVNSTGTFLLNLPKKKASCSIIM